MSNKCELKQGTLPKFIGQITAKLIKNFSDEKREDKLTADHIVRHVYQYTKQELLDKSYNEDEAIAIALSAAEYIGLTLPVVYKYYHDKKYEEIKAFGIGNDEVTEEYINNKFGKYSKPEDVRKLLNINPLPILQEKVITRDSVQPFLDKIKESFPQGKISTIEHFDNRKYKATLSEIDGVTLARVTRFVKRMSYDESTVNDISIKVGNLSDFVVRQFLKHEGDLQSFLDKMPTIEKFQKLYLSAANYGRFENLNLKFEDENLKNL